MKFRTKPVAVDAFQYDGDFQGVNGWYVPKWAVMALKMGTLYYGELKGVPAELFLKTPKGTKHVAVGDYLIRDPKGVIYSVKPDIFKKEYA